MTTQTPRMFLRRAGPWLLLVALLLLICAGVFTHWLTNTFTQRISALLTVEAEIGGWHLDPRRPALVLRSLHLSSEGEPILAIGKLTLKFGGFSWDKGLIPHYSIELDSPHLRLERDPEGHYAWGRIILPPESHGTHPSFLPESVKISEGDIAIIERGGSSHQTLADLSHLDGFFTIDPRTEGFRHHLIWNDAQGGTYNLDATRAAKSDPIDLALDLKAAHIEPWVHLMPDTLTLTPVSGEMTGQMAFHIDPIHPKESSMTAANVRADDLLVKRKGDIDIFMTLAHFESKALIIDPAHTHYQVEGLEFLELKGPDDGVDRISIASYDSLSAKENPTLEPIRLIGLRHQLTWVSEMTLEGPHLKDTDQAFHLDAMTIRGVDGARVTAADIHFRDLSFNPTTRELRAEQGDSQEVSGVFGALTDIGARGIVLSLKDDSLILDRIEFSLSNTKTFETVGGWAEGIFWSRLHHDIEVRHTHLGRSSFHQLRVSGLDAVESVFHTQSKLLEVRELKLHEGWVADDTSPQQHLLDIKAAQFRNFRTDAVDRQWGAEHVDVTRASVEGWIHPDNHFEIRGLTTGLGKPGQPNQPNHGARPEKQWTYQIGAIALHDSSLQLTDLGTTPATQIPFHDLELEADDLGSQGQDDSDITLHARIGNHGHLDLSGRFNRHPASAVVRFDLKQFRLPLINPYWNAVSRLRLKRGHLDLSGELRVIPGDPRHIEFEGDSRIEGFEADNPETGRHILAFKTLSLDDIAISSHPKRFYTRVLDMDGAYLHGVVDEQHHLNLMDLFRIDKSPGAPTEVEAIKFEPSPHHEPPHAAIGLVRLKDSRLDYSDLGMKPPLSTSIRELNGTVKGLSSRRDGTADISLMGKINRNSPVRLSGVIEPMDYRDHTDILLDFTGLNLTSFPQYAGRFSSYRIERGKLNLDLHYKINQTEMNVDNRAMIDRLTLGERIDPERHPLTEFALWILMDSRGNLDVDLPVYGDLQNPSYELSALYGEAVLHLFSKVFTSPATFVQDLIPTTRQHLSLPFSPGQREADGFVKDSLKVIVDAFRDQDGGIIEITPAAVPEVDGEAMASENLHQELKTRFIREQRKAGISVPDKETIHLSGAALKRQLSIYHKTHHPELIQDLAIDEMDETEANVINGKAWKVALEDWRSEPDIVLDLAEDRAESIRRRLIRDYGIGEEWIYLREAEFLPNQNPVPLSIDFYSD